MNNHDLFQKWDLVKFWLVQLEQSIAHLLWSTLISPVALSAFWWVLFKLFIDCYFLLSQSPATPAYLFAGGCIFATVVELAYQSHQIMEGAVARSSIGKNERNIISRYPNVIFSKTNRTWPWTRFGLNRSLWWKMVSIECHQKITSYGAYRICHRSSNGKPWTFTQDVPNRRYFFILINHIFSWFSIISSSGSTTSNLSKFLRTVSQIYLFMMIIHG